MKFRFTAKTLVGAAAMVAMGASLATAQARPTSTKRIPISKDSPGEVVKDTVMVYKTDTVRVTQQLPGRVDTVRTTNTVYAPTPSPLLRWRRRFVYLVACISELAAA